MSKMTERTKKLTTVAMLCAVAYAVMVIGRIPVTPPPYEFLTLDPKDVILAIGGFLYGPFTAFLMSLVVGLLEMLTVSATGPIGMVMNVLGSAAFACTAAFVYKKKQTMVGAVVGLGLGTVMMTGVMLLWNYFITPLYTGAPRAVIEAALLPVFLPFNLIKGGINAALTLLLYKPLVLALRKTGLVAASKNTGSKRAMSPGLMVTAGVVLVSLAMLILVWQGIL